MFDSEHNDDDEDQSYFAATSMERLQNLALSMFARFLTEISNRPVSEQMSDWSRQFLSLQEIALIMRDYGQETEDGFILGGDTHEEMTEKMTELMGAIMKRILSNVLAKGVDLGLLDCEFNTDTNEFDFGVTEEGKRIVNGDTSK